MTSDYHRATEPQSQILEKKCFAPRRKLACLKKFERFGGLYSPENCMTQA